ncbi:vesicle-fusing ATPase [Nematocida parisii]|uniref:Vesicular-fusion protein SEC18 n=1 Tax=Nematocida parisii (strain ERTm3) TaxID=935791 RepID=I3EJM9_NEMP3|nr:vesicular-fusion protein SEC18 [Nematocida parisii ERTm3]KAI5145205.1 vesicle-fusing ATPase [Nematocida parisii]KAI5157785.1 vesicle-fusing ATPase [Nematocida parisii]
MGQYKVERMKNILRAHENKVYISAEYTGDYCIIKGYVFKVRVDRDLPPYSVSLSQVQRVFMDIKENEYVDVINGPRGVMGEIEEVTISIEGKTRGVHIRINHRIINNTFLKILSGVPLTEEQDLGLLMEIEPSADISNKEVMFICKVEKIKLPNKEVIGVVNNNTKIVIKDHQGITILGMGGELSMNTEFDFLEMEIGGLKKEFAEMFRRAFIQRMYKPGFIKDMGISHVKGIMLYGPPGTGKTLIARRMSALLNSAPPKIVNGPEILNKYVGQSEENIRKLFEDAEKDYKQYGDESALHIIIFDEIDAICKSRGSSNGVGDQVVNQLLSKIDGVESLNNILVIGMTNRVDLIDDALLRPGRFEIHIEISLPDEAGRLEILKIHTSKMETNCFMKKDIDLEEIAKRARNYTGAEITALVKSAASFALERARNTKKEVMIDMHDFKKALDETAPAFGVSTALRLPEPFYAYPSAQEVIKHGETIVSRLRKDTAKKSKTLSLLLTGRPGTGKTALAEIIAKKSEIPFIRVISPKDIVGKEENEKVNYIRNTFKDAYKSAESLVILDDIEGLMEYVSIGPRFLNPILQAIKLFAKNQDRFKVMVIGTAADKSLMEESGIFGSFDSHLELSTLTNKDIDWFTGNTALAPATQKTIKEIIQ